MPKYFSQVIDQGVFHRGSMNFYHSWVNTAFVLLDSVVFWLFSILCFSLGKGHLLYRIYRILGKVSREAAIIDTAKNVCKF